METPNRQPYRHVRNEYDREDPADVETMDTGREDLVRAILAERWRREPVDWRESCDLAVGEQVRGDARPGAARDTPHGVLRLRLPAGLAEAERLNGAGRTGYRHGRYAFRQADDNGQRWNVHRNGRTTTIGTVTRTGDGGGIRRADQWGTLIATAHNSDPAADAGTVEARLMTAAALLFDAPLPQRSPPAAHRQDTTRPRTDRTGRRATDEPPDSER